MKKIALFVLALAALSTASLANERRTYELRESPTYFGKYSENATNKSATTMTRAFAVKKVVKTEGSGMTNFERLMKISIENDQGRH